MRERVAVTWQDHPFRDYLLGAFNLIWWKFASGPAFEMFGSNRPTLWQRITTREATDE